MRFNSKGRNTFRDQDFQLKRILAAGSSEDRRVVFTCLHAEPGIRSGLILPDNDCDLQDPGLS
ncbi:MAG TPA: hypothetical protein DD727_09880 [Clostridiales bacterium]|nr:hypothetical protein [Clostridiales bacterium]